jgi:hypothetical protein
LQSGTADEIIAACAKAQAPDQLAAYARALAQVGGARGERWLADQSGE